MDHWTCVEKENWVKELFVARKKQKICKGTKWNYWKKDKKNDVQGKYENLSFGIGVRKRLLSLIHSVAEKN